MEPAHPDTNASLKIFEMNKARATVKQKKDITNTPFDIDTMASVLSANTVILPSSYTHTSPFLLLMEESHTRNPPARTQN